MNPNGKYTQFNPIDIPDRTWPSKQITQAPTWCSVDLRDGNQALAIPMTIEQKLEFFDVLVGCGFKEIEVGFPAASKTEFDFIRRLIVENRIPSDVTIQVLVQAREDQIKETVESLKGAKRVIIHLYNSTSPAQRDIVFGLQKQQVIDLAVQGTRWIKEYSATLTETEVVFQYSPESFSATEIEFSLEICTAVSNEWCPSVTDKMILNLPDTVEVAIPNVYADQIEWFGRHIPNRDSILISIHTHNDRGTGVAKTELGLLAGADRVEGTLFGNGERTGNVDLVTLALNMYTQGVDPELDFSNLEALVEVYGRCIGMPISPRHPYSGELVFTAFSGSHQDAIRKGLARREVQVSPGRVIPWNVPYFTIDPNDVGRKYEKIIRINSQSGKGGIGHVLEQEFGICLPRDLLRDFAIIAGRQIDASQKEATSTDLKSMLWKEYVEHTSLYTLKDFAQHDNLVFCTCTATMDTPRGEKEITGEGNGPIDAFVSALKQCGVMDVNVIDQGQHTLAEGASANAIGYAKLQFPNGEIRWGIGIDTSVQLATIRAIISAINRLV